MKAQELTKKVYVVDGSYRNDSENGSTGDYVVATSEQEAERLAQEVRDVTGDVWCCDAVDTVEAQIARLQKVLDTPIDEVETYLEDTLENLGGLRCEKCKVVFLGECSGDDSLCPGCADKESGDEDEECECGRDAEDCATAEGADYCCDRDEYVKAGYPATFHEFCVKARPDMLDDEEKV